MSEPVTTNPFVIMLINMTVVFIVLIALGLVINLIHAIDPTKEKEKPKAVPAPAAPAPAPAPAPIAADGVSPEVIAVIAAALASYGYRPAAIRAVRPLERSGWKNAGRSFGVQRTLE